MISSFDADPRIQISKGSATEHLNEIGRLLAEGDGHSASRTLLYATLADNVVGADIFQDMGDHIAFRWPDYDRIAAPLSELWDDQPSGHPNWSLLEFFLRDGKFEAKFVYSDQLDPAEDSDERRTRIVEKYFGKKPVLYPPLPSRDASMGFDPPKPSPS